MSLAASARRWANRSIRRCVTARGVPLLIVTANAVALLRTMVAVVPLAPRT